MMGKAFGELGRLDDRKLEIVRQVFNVIYNCQQAPEQWERGHRILVELLDRWDEPSGER